jgi:3',5'-cyclic AMP phosphodiesterase CpdA
MRKLVLIAVVVTGIASWPLAGQEMSPAVQPGSLKFAVIGDNGTGAKPQFDVGQQLAAARAAFPFEIVLMLGDNMYGSQRPADFVDKFERPYAALLQAGVPFYAALGNHDNQSNRFYKGFNMSGERYYTFAKRNVRFFVFDTNLMDATQLAWIENTLRQSQDDWKIAYFHHPLYSDAGRHGSNVELRVVLEPLLVRHGISAVFSGHEHVYQRTTPQKGITYFIEGSSGQLRKGDMRPTAMTAASFDQDQTFMLVEIDGNEMRFRTMSRTGRVVDSGVIRRRPTT